MKNLNLVILGLASSGKSALLGALQQAAQTKGTGLEGELVDLSGELEQLRKVSLGDKYHPTRTAVAAYPVQRHVDGRDETVTLLDTSGTDSAAVLSGQEDLAGAAPLPHALADADAVLLVVDVSASLNDLNSQFSQTVKFLNAWQAQRGRAAKVGGLPVFLVLAKCDKIAKEGETFGQWTQRVEDRKRKVGETFHKALEASRDRSFGRVDLRVWATAAKRPVAEKSSRLNEPYQVAELFGQVFDAAGAYRARIERSSQTLQGAIVGIGGVAALLLLIVGWYYVTEPSLDEAALESQVAALLAGGEDNVAERVREPIEDRLKELRDVQANPAYGQLPVRVREQLSATEKSLLDYQQLNTRYQKDVKNPRIVQTEKQLAEAEKQLARYDDELKAWPETRLAKRHDGWKAEAAAIRKAIDEEIAWMNAKKAEGNKLYEEGGEVIAKKVDPATRDKWFRDALEFEFAGNRHKANDRVGATTVPYRAIYEFDSVKAAERAWGRTKTRLKDLRAGALEN